MEKGKVLYREKLTKKFYMQLPEELYLVSNIHDTRFQARYAEETAGLDQKENQWKKIVAAGVSQTLCYVFKTKKDYEVWLNQANYKPDKTKKQTVH